MKILERLSNQQVISNVSFFNTPNRPLYSNTDANVWQMISKNDKFDSPPPYDDVVTNTTINL